MISTSFLIEPLSNLDRKLFDNTDSLQTNMLLFGNESPNTNHNTVIFNATMKIILSTKRSDEPLFISLVF